MIKAFEKAFTEWERRYREDPSSFWSEAEKLLGHTPESYGEACGAYMVSLLNELSAGRPWDTIGA